MHLKPSLYFHREGFSKTDSQIQAIATTEYTEKGHVTMYIHSKRKQRSKILPLCMLLMQLSAPETFAPIRVRLRTYRYMQHTSSRYAWSYWLDADTEMRYQNP